jgi:hypothetical protein
MKRYLLAAEADKIQDFIFSATHLREVVGGSQILARFCDRAEGAPQALGVPDGDLVVSGGGSFRVLFDTPEQATRFGEQLAEVYRRAVNGSLTVIDAPEAVDETDDAGFGRAGQVVQEKLRLAKRQRRGRRATVQFPYVATCASCGVGLATAHQKRHTQDERPQYFCDTCLAKAAERSEKSLGAFLKPFVQAVIGEGESPEQYTWPGGARGREGAQKEIDPTLDVGRFDSRNYVAYLLADGNHMGQVFDQCSKQQMRQLSEGLTKTLRTSLAQATRALKEVTCELMQRRPKIKVENFIPVLPLILGGDDLFALLPAPWALDFAQRFCAEFETQMTKLVDGLGLPNRAQLPKRMTAGAAVVICKANYPFYLAHAIGEERLSQAKQITKRLHQGGGGAMRSVVNFEIILGSQAGAKPQQGPFRATLRPYWNDEAAVPPGWGVRLEALLAQRLELYSLPQKRLAQLRALYYPSALPSSADELPDWIARRDALFKRIGRDERMLEKVKAAFDALGGPDWHVSARAGEEGWRGHGIPDLLEAWDFAYQIDQPLRAYEGGAR